MRECKDNQSNMCDTSHASEPIRAPLTSHDVERHAPTNVQAFIQDSDPIQTQFVVN